MSVNVCIVCFFVEVIQNMRILKLLIGLFSLSYFSHYVFLQGPGQIVGVTEVKPLIDLDLLEVVYISIFVVTILSGGGFKHRNKLHIFDHVNGVAQYFGYSFALSHQNQVKPFQKPDEAEDTKCFFDFYFIGAVPVNSLL